MFRYRSVFDASRHLYSHYSLWEPDRREGCLLSLKCLVIRCLVALKRCIAMKGTCQ